MNNTNKILFIIFSIITVTIIGLYICFSIVFGDKKAVVKIVNKKNGEYIYLINTSWGNDDRMAIGLDNELKSGFEYIYPEKYNTDFKTTFLYKFSNDTFIVVNSRFKEPKTNKFKTPIKLVEMEDYDFRQLYENNKYKGLGFKVFPETQ